MTTAMCLDNDPVLGVKFHLKEIRESVLLSMTIVVDKTFKVQIHEKMLINALRKCKRRKSCIVYWSAELHSTSALCMLLVRRTGVQVLGVLVTPSLRVIEVRYMVELEYWELLPCTRSCTPYNV